MAGIRGIESSFRANVTSTELGEASANGMVAKFTATPSSPRTNLPIAVKAAKPDPAPLQFSNVLAQYARTWQQADRKTNALLGSVPANIRPLIDAQMTLSRLDLQTQLLTKVADAVGNTIRRTQQMAGG